MAGLVPISYTNHTFFPLLNSKKNTDSQVFILVQFLSFVMQYFHVVVYFFSISRKAATKCSFLTKTSLKNQSHMGCDRDATSSRPISLQLTGDR